jgi:peroxiredoxin Q/BCP
MKNLKIGDKAPDFTLPGDGGGEVSLASYRGRKVVLYFYPKDDTPGCTAESCSFRDNLPDFEGMGAAVIGISKDSAKKHDKFKAKYDLNFPLASDENGDVCERYGVWTEKSMYGRKYMGIDRSTFLIDENGKIAALWRGVKVPGHVESVREAVLGLSQAA